MITFGCEGVRMPALRRRDTAAWIRGVAAKYGRTVGDIGYMFVDEERILQINREYLGHDYYTDIITFDYSEGRVISGDIVISVATVASNAALYGKSVGEELLRVVIHGVLHLCGIDDKGPGERAMMEREEDAALAMYGASGGTR